MASHRPLALRKPNRRLRTIFRATANGLNPATYTAWPVRYALVETKEIRKVGGITIVDEGGLPVRETEEKLVKVATQCAVNHFRRLKRAWARHGIEGYNRYLVSLGADSLLPQA